MPYYDRIDISKGIDHAKIKNSKEHMNCHYSFFNHGFKFQHNICNGCHDLTMVIIVILFMILTNLKQFIY